MPPDPNLFKCEHVDMLFKLLQKLNEGRELGIAEKEALEMRNVHKNGYRMNQLSMASAMKLANSKKKMAVAARSSEQTAGAMTGEYIPDEKSPAEFTDKKTLGDWTECGEHEFQKVNFGVCCGNWGGSFPNNPQKQDKMTRDVLSSIGHI